MDYSTIFAVWAVATTGPCVLSWLAGDMAGSARMRALYSEDSGAVPNTDSANDEASAMRVEAWRVPGTIRPLRDASAWDALESPAARGFEEQAALAERRREQRWAMSATRPRGDQACDALWSATDAGVEPVGSPGGFGGDNRSPDPREALDHYERSVEVMRRSNRDRGGHERGHFRPEPAWRVSDHEPILITTSADELLRQRYP